MKKHLLAATLLLKMTSSFGQITTYANLSEWDDKVPQIKSFDIDFVRASGNYYYNYDHKMNWRIQSFLNPIYSDKELYIKYIRNNGEDAPVHHDYDRPYRTHYVGELVDHT